MVTQSQAIENIVRKGEYTGGHKFFLCSQSSPGQFVAFQQHIIYHLHIVGWVQCYPKCQYKVETLRIVLHSPNDMLLNWTNSTFCCLHCKQMLLFDKKVFCIWVVKNRCLNYQPVTRTILSSERLKF